MTGGLEGIRRRDLAAVFRTLRYDKGRTIDEVAECLDCAPERVVRIEEGTLALRTAQVRDLLDLYEVQGESRRSLLHRAQLVGMRNWWYPYADLLDDDFESLLILEDEASAMRTHQPNLIPGLLQTDRYAWELMATLSDLPLEVIQRRIRLRMGRQRILARSTPPHFAVLLDEAALRRPVGGDAVMRGQYERLIEVAETPAVDLRVLPLRAGPHPAMGFSFHIYEFNGDDPRVIQLEWLDREHFADEAAEVGQYVDAFEQAALRALDSERSLEFLRRLAGRD